MKLRNLALGYCLLTGAAMIVVWLILLASGNITEMETRPLEMYVHVISEGLTAVLLVVSGLTLLKTNYKSYKLYIFSLGMLTYSVMNAAGYYWQKQNTIMVVMFSVFFILSVTLAFSAKQEIVLGEEGTLRKMEYDIADALKRNDYKFLEKAYSDDYICTTPSGNRTDKHCVMKEIVCPEVIIKQYEINVLDIRVRGNYAVVIGEAMVKGHLANKNIHGTYRYTHIFFKHSMEWQMTAAHISKFEG